MKNTKHKKHAKPKFNKDDVTRKSSIIFTQLGLVFALLLTYLAIESKTLVNDDVVKYIPHTPYDIDDIIPDTTPEKLKELKPDPISVPEPDMSELDIKDDNDDFIESDVFSSEDNSDKGIELKDYSSFDEEDIPEEDIEDVPFILIENAPIFPGCSGSKEEMKQCFSNSVKKLVIKKFNGDLAQELGLSSGKKRIAVQFTVDKKGNISDILVRAPHKRLEKEARRVVNLLPEMTPGKQRGRAVGVKFTLPITFMVE